MNKREFYKELMSEYMFDKEKICANAKKGKFAGRKSYPIYIGMTAAVAAVVVVAGTAAFTMLGKRDANITTAAMSNQERIDRAIEDIRLYAGSEEKIDLLISFRTALSPRTVKSVLSEFSDGSGSVKTLIMEDESAVTGNGEIGTVFRNNSDMIRGAVFNCAGYKMAKIQNNEYVALVEVATPDRLAQLTTVKDVEPPVVSEPTVSEPDVSKPQNNTSSNVGDNTHEPSAIDDPKPGISVSEPSIPSNPGGEDPNQQTSDPKNPEGNVPSDPHTPENPGEPIKPGVENPPVPSTVTSRLPEGVKLPLEVPAGASFITDDIGAQKAYFLSEDVFYVKTENAVKLYKWDGEHETLAAEQTVLDAKVTWVSANGLRLMVSGVENGVRSKMYIVDAKNCTINDMAVGEMVGEGSIFEAAYNEELNLLVLNIVEEDSKYIFTAKLSGYQATDPQMVAYGSKTIMLLGAHKDAVYYSEATGGMTAVYRSGIEENPQVEVLNGLYLPTANPAFTHALLVSESDVMLFDPADEEFISIPIPKTVSFGASLHSYYDGKGYCTIKGGAVVPENNIAEIAKVDFMRSFSSRYAAVVSNGSVRIVPSVYTKQVRNDGITFEEPTEKASTEQREAVNSAIGVVNALVGGSVSKSGINSSEKLAEVINACYSKNAAQFLMARCEVAQSGELSYSDGSLTALNVSDTVLVMDDETTGKLYVKVGTFEGKTAYSVKSVSLVNENGLKLDGII